jgi:hypothetical protein
MLSLRIQGKTKMILQIMMLGGWFADLLHRDGAMDEMEYMRWTRFERRLQRWDQKKNQ